MRRHWKCPPAIHLREKYLYEIKMFRNKTDSNVTNCFSFFFLLFLWMLQTFLAVNNLNFLNISLPSLYFCFFIKNTCHTSTKNLFFLISWICWRSSTAFKPNRNKMFLDKGTANFLVLQAHLLSKVPIKLPDLTNLDIYLVWYLPEIM